ncbi:hypothetical protein [Synechococcus sp. M16CYN]
MSPLNNEIKREGVIRLTDADAFLQVAPTSADNLKQVPSNRESC